MNSTAAPSHELTPAVAPPPPRFAMSVDVEDYFQVWAFSNVIDRADWDHYAPRFDDSTRRVLDLFDETGAKATFFVLGWAAEKAPGLIREIVARGHEVGSHGYAHVKVFEQSRSEFKDDVAKTKRLLEDCSGQAASGYRAAGFSIDHRTPWAYDVLAEAGHVYSSSLHPIRHDHYGDPTALQTAFRPIAGADFVETPVATTSVLGRRVSAAGGGWFRAAPYQLSKALIKRAADRSGGPIVFYFHPWEVDPDQPRVRGASMRSSLRHYLNLSDMTRKLRLLLRDFRWEPIGATLERDAHRRAA